MSKAHKPNSIRIWKSYRTNNDTINHERFIDVLGGLFIPTTVTVMEPTGLHNYFSARKVESETSLSDEIALLAYLPLDNKANATATVNAYGALYRAFFNFSSLSELPESKSDAPVAYKKSIEVGQPYYLCDDSIDWCDNKTRLYCAKKLPQVTTRQMLGHVEKVIPEWQKNNGTINGSLLVCENDYVLYWEHSSFRDTASSVNSLFPFFSSVLQSPIISDQRTLRTIPYLNPKQHKAFQVNSEHAYTHKLNKQTVHKKLPPVRIKLENRTS